MTGDDYMDAVESDDPKVCYTYGHDFYSPTICRRCGVAYWPTEGTHA